MGDHLLDRHPVHEHVEHRALDRVRVQPLRHGQVALRVEVDAEDVEPPLPERHAEVERRRRLRDAALLVREREHLRVGEAWRCGGRTARVRKERRESHVHG